MKKIFVAVALFCLAPPIVQAQISGTGLSAVMGTGYGLYVVTMRPSAQAGTISSFYLYNQSGTWPARWHEIDIEFTPGFNGNGKIDDPFNPNILASGKACYSKQPGSDNLPLSKQDCQLTPVPKTSGINSYISLNAYNHRAWDGHPVATDNIIYPHSDNQVFLPSNIGTAIYTQPRTYVFYYTPNGIYWSKDLPAIPLVKDQEPSALLLASPIAFVKKDIRIVNANSLWSPGDHAIDSKPGEAVKAPNFPLNEAFAYDNVPLTPLLEDKKTLADAGTLMYLSINLWDGSCSTTKECRAWGGSKAPLPGKETSAYWQLAYYPLQTPAVQAMKILDPSTLHYGKPALYSDFVKGIFLANQQSIAFADLWHAPDGSYLEPIGRLDERNLHCGYGKPLTMSLQDYPQARKNTDAASLNACPWLGDNQLP